MYIFTSINNVSVSPRICGVKWVGIYIVGLCGVCTKKCVCVCVCLCLCVF